MSLYVLPGVRRKSSCLHLEQLFFTFTPPFPYRPSWSKALKIFFSSFSKSFCTEKRKRSQLCTLERTDIHYLSYFTVHKDELKLLTVVERKQKRETAVTAICHMLTLLAEALLMQRDKEGLQEESMSCRDRTRTASCTYVCSTVRTRTVLHLLCSFVFCR